MTKLQRAQDLTGLPHNLVALDTGTFKHTAKYTAMRRHSDEETAMKRHSNEHNEK